MKATLTILLCVPLSFGIAQTLKQKADSLYKIKEWKAALVFYAKHLKNNDQDSSSWYNSGICHYQLEEHTLAIEQLNMAIKTNYNHSLASFNIAKSYLSQSQSDKALKVLEAGAKKGLPFYTQLSSDPIFDPIRSNELFAKILRSVELNAYPCLSNEDMRLFDFWLGEWDVYFQGNKVGENSITMAKGGCAIHESYTTARNYAGQSINYYDPIDKKWHQHWVGSGGDVFNYLETERSPGRLQFLSEFMNPNGQITLSRLTFTLNEDGSVNQLFENSSDDGKTWSSGFDGHYVKKK